MKIGDIFEMLDTVNQVSLFVLYIKCVI